jgi:hypothetical protein
MSHRGDQRWRDSPSKTKSAGFGPPDWSIIRKSGNRFCLKTNAWRLRGDHTQTASLDHDPISLNRIMI